MQAPQEYRKVVLKESGGDGSWVAPWINTATADKAGVVKADGKTIFVWDDGTLSLNPQPGSEQPGGGGTGGGSTHTGDIYEFYIWKDPEISDSGCCSSSTFPGAYPGEQSVMIEYTGPNADFTPACMDGYNDSRQFDYGSWKDTWIMNLCRPCMMKATGVDYYLDPTDMSKKKDGGSASDYNNIDYDGPGVFVEIDQVWIKEEDEEDRIHIWLSPIQQEGFDCLSHMDEDGNLCSHIYRGKYPAIYRETGCKSLSGQDPTAEGNYDTDVNQYASCTKWGKGWQCEDWSFLRLMWYLHLLICKSTNPQMKIGAGKRISDQYISQINGENDKKGQFYGTGPSYDDTNYEVTSFYMDSMWGRQSRLIAGIYTSSVVDLNTRTYTQAIKMQPPYIISNNLQESDLQEAGYTNLVPSISTDSAYLQNMKLYKGIGLLPYGTYQGSTGYLAYWGDLAWFTLEDGKATPLRAGNGDYLSYNDAGVGSGLFALYSSGNSGYPQSDPKINGFVPMFKLASA